jgi:hypothetical protein
VRAVIHGSQAVSTSGVGVINTVINMDPSLVSGTDWADYSTTYDEFRVLGVKCQIVSTQQFSVTAVNAAAVVIYDNDDTTALTGFNEGRQYSTHHVISAVMMHPQGRPWAATWTRPTSGQLNSIPWIDIGAPTTSPGAIKFYAGGLTVSASYFVVMTDFYVEFRGRR